MDELVESHNGRDFLGCGTSGPVLAVKQPVVMSIFETGDA
jgi:hypothetical protein